MIPRRFFWLFDWLTLFIAFAVAYALIPHLVPLFGPGGPLRISWLSFLDPPVIGEGKLPPLSESLWVYFTMALTALVTLGLLGQHGSLLNQSRAKIIAGSFLASMGGVSLITLVMFALKSPGLSRLLVFVFALFSWISLAAYRLVLHRYFVSRRAAGYYQKNVLLIGLASSIEWMTRYFADTVAGRDHRLIGYLRVDAEPIVELYEQTIKGLALPELPLLGDAQELGALLIHLPVEEVIAIHPTAGGE